MSEAISRAEARTIAHEVDPMAGDFFRRMLISAAIKGAELAAKQAGDTVPRARLKSILDDCENDFHACRRCGDQDDNATKESNLYLLLRHLIDPSQGGVPAPRDTQ